MTDRNLFADAAVIHSYTRAQATDDGVLVDVSGWALELGFVVPVALTAHVWAALQVPPEDQAHARLHDLLWLAFLAARRYRHAQQVAFDVTIERETHALWIHVGPGDDPAPVVTIGYPHDF